MVDHPSLLIEEQLSIIVCDHPRSNSLSFLFKCFVCKYLPTISRKQIDGEEKTPSVLSTFLRSAVEFQKTVTSEFLPYLMLRILL